MHLAGLPLGQIQHAHASSRGAVSGLRCELGMLDVVSEAGHELCFLSGPKARIALLHAQGWSRETVAHMEQGAGGCAATTIAPRPSCGLATAAVAPCRSRRIHLNFSTRSFTRRDGAPATRSPPALFLPKCLRLSPLPKSPAAASPSGRGSMRAKCSPRASRARENQGCSRRFAYAPPFFMSDGPEKKC